jgi:hypothetical protein
MWNGSKDVFITCDEERRLRTGGMLRPVTAMSSSMTAPISFLRAYFSEIDVTLNPVDSGRLRALGGFLSGRDDEFRRKFSQESIV